MMRWVGHVAIMGEKRNVYRLLVGESEGKKPLGRPRRRWIDNIKMGLVEIGLNVVDWIGVAQEVCTAVTMKNVVYWHIKTQFIPHRRHITSPLQRPAS
jgi:hypothetical protein